ncbi:serine/threonine protein kinase PrkT [Bacillaceae bacterium]
MSFNPANRFPPQGKWHPKKGETIIGKWHGRAYEVIECLGEGANGKVWRVRHEGKDYALKVSENGCELLAEANALKALTGARGNDLGPSLYDVDDWERQGKTHAFYVMTCVEGIPAKTFLQQKGRDWFFVLYEQLVGKLACLHDRGWVFGDLKPEHLVVDPGTGEVKFVDFGGATPIGRAVRQYTVPYDRASWKAGDRRADPGFDFFSAALVCVFFLCDEREWETLCKEPRSVRRLCDIIRKDRTLSFYQELLLPLLQGGLGDRDSSLRLSRNGAGRPMLRPVARPVTRRRLPWIEGAFVVSFLFFLYSLILLW